ncbi:MAG: hypothetical protein J5980_09050 [Muribaculaceae bacterium]|nr:hypothetical protein [Muribaculaceae bacterium]
MKKMLLTVAVAAISLAAGAITADEAAQMTLRFDAVDGAPLFTSMNTTNTQLVESATAGMWEIVNFYNDMNLKLTIADDGTVTVAPQTLGGDYDYTTYESVYYMIVPQESVNKSPMDVYNDRVNGSYIDGMLQLEPWNIIVVNQSFSENRGAQFAEGRTTSICAPNASVSRGMWMADLDDNDRFQGWERLSMWPDRHNVRVQEAYGILSIGHFLGMYSECPVANFALDLDAKTVTFDAMSTVVRTASGNDYTMMAIPETLTDQHQAGLADTPVVGTISDDYTTITISNFCVMRSDEDFQTVDYCHGNPVHTLVITLDEPLTTGSTTAIADAKAAKAVESVSYVNLAGQTSTTPFQGVNIVVTRYADGTTSTAKVVR